MRKLIRYFNQNRTKILLIVSIIVFLIIFVRVLNYIVKNNIQEESNNVYNSYSEGYRDTTLPEETIISGDEISKEDAEEDRNIIESFVKACNSKDYATAYNMLTNDCKNIVFSGTMDSFVKNYCDLIFQTSKTYQLEGWISKAEGQTYKVTYLEDNILATGGISEGLNYTDYITITRENGEDKLSIYNFINSYDTEKTENENNVEIKVTRQDIYMDYVVYSFTITNNSENTILLSDNSDNKQICLVDEHDSEYISYLNEIPQFNLIINRGEQKKFTIRFAKGYNSSTSARYIRFKNIYLDYNAYINNPNDENLQKIQMDIKI